MIVLGLLVMLACAALAADAVVQNNHGIHAVAFNQPISHLSTGTTFVAGAVLGLLFALGLVMFTGGLGRAGRRRRANRARLQESQAEAEALRAHNARLQAAANSNDAYPAEPAAAADNRQRVSAGRHRA